MVRGRPDGRANTRAGVGSGIGWATAIGLSADGFRVTLTGQRQTALEETSDVRSTPVIL